MNLISISPNVLINPEYICYIEQRKTKVGVSIKIGVEGKEFELDRDIKEFYKDLGLMGQDDGSQHFAG